METYVFVKPTDTTDSNYSRDLSIYNAAMDSVRKRISNDALDPILITDLPNDFIGDPVFIVPAERQVLAHKQIAAADVAAHKLANDATYQELLLLVILRVCVEILPELPEEVRLMLVDTTIQNAELGIEKKMTYLENTYIRLINPATDIPDTPGGGSGGDAEATVLLTRSRL